MSNDTIRQQEIYDHKELMEKIRILCDKLDELFLLYDQIQQQVPDHNVDPDAHRDIREHVITVDEREADHYSTLSTTVTNNNTAINTRVDNLAATITNTNSITTDSIERLEEICNAILNCDNTYNNPLKSSVVSQTFLNANTGKVSLNNTAPYGYNMLLRVKSENGVFVEGAYRNKYQVSYTADTTIASSTNRNDKTNILIDESGNASFCNNVTVAGTLTADSIVGTIATKVAEAETADTSTLAEGATSLVSDTEFNTTDTHLLKYSSGQFNGFVGSNDNVTTLSYPAGSTTVANNIANIQNIRLLWAGGSKYWHDIFVSPNQRYIWHRDVRSGTANPWARIVEESTDTTWNINISGSADSATNATNATHAVSADSAINATHATTANKALLADDATHAATADAAVNATNATYATTAGSATSATNATTATSATSATNDANGNNIVSYYVNTETNQTINGNKTFEGDLIAHNLVNVASTAPQLRFDLTNMYKGLYGEGWASISFNDTHGLPLADIGYSVTSSLSGLKLTAISWTGSNRAVIHVGFNTADESTPELQLDVANVVPVRSSSAGGVTLGRDDAKFTNTYTSGIVLDPDGVGTVKLLAREYTAPTSTSSYVNIPGSSLYAVSMRTSNVQASGAVTTATPELIIDTDAVQAGTWQPLQYLSGSWRADGNFIIALYRRIL